MRLYKKIIALVSSRLFLSAFLALSVFPEVSHAYGSGECGGACTKMRECLHGYDFPYDTVGDCTSECQGVEISQEWESILKCDTSDACEDYIQCISYSEDELSPPDPYKKSFAMLLDPAGIALGAILGFVIIDPDFQYAFMDYIALDVKPGFAYYYGDWIDVDLIGGGGSVGLRVMPLGTRLEGFYIVTRAQTLYLAGESGSVSLETLVVTPSLELGNSWIWGHFIMNAGGGIGYNMSVMGDDIYEDDDLHGVAMLINFSIGFVI